MDDVSVKNDSKNPTMKAKFDVLWKENTFVFSKRTLPCPWMGKPWTMWHLEKWKGPSSNYTRLGDGLSSSERHSFSLSYRLLFKQVYKIYVFLDQWAETGYKTRDMAADVAEAMEVLNITSALMGMRNDCSMASCRFPWKVQKLILAATTAKPSQSC